MVSESPISCVSKSTDWDCDSVDGNSYEYEDREDPNNQLLAEFWSSFPTSNQYDSSKRIPATDSVDAPPSATFQGNNQDAFLHIAASDSVSTPPYVSLSATNKDDPFMQVSAAFNQERLV